MKVIKVSGVRLSKVDRRWVWLVIWDRWEDPTDKWVDPWWEDRWDLRVTWCSSIRDGAPAPKPVDTPVTALNTMLRGGALRRGHLSSNKFLRRHHISGEVTTTYSLPLRPKAMEAMVSHWQNLSILCVSIIYSVLLLQVHDYLGRDSFAFTAILKILLKGEKLDDIGNSFLSVSYYQIINFFFLLFSLFAGEY